MCYLFSRKPSHKTPPPSYLRIWETDGVFCTSGIKPSCTKCQNFVHHIYKDISEFSLNKNLEISHDSEYINSFGHNLNYKASFILVST